MATVKERRPKVFTLDDLDEELYSMALIRSLPDDYTLFKDALVLLDDVSPATVSEAFRNRHQSDLQRAQNDENSAMAMGAATSSPSCILCNASHRTEDCPHHCYAFTSKPPSFLQRQSCCSLCPFMESLLDV